MANGSPDRPAEQLSVDDLVDLAEQLRDLGVQSFQYGTFAVVFRPNAAVPATATQSPPRNEDNKPRDLAALAATQGIGRPSWPGSKSA